MSYTIRYVPLTEVKNDEFFILDQLINYIKAISNIDFVKWLEAMISKMDFMHTNRIRTLVDTSERIKPIRYKMGL